MTVMLSLVKNSLVKKEVSSHFDPTEVIEAELQAVLNTLTEHNLQDAFIKW
jgi:hypothetical protein